jgi:hypothetical protein
MRKYLQALDAHVMTTQLNFGDSRGARAISFPPYPIVQPDAHTHKVGFAADEKLAMCVMRQCTKQTRPPAQRVGNDNNNKSSRPFQREIAVRGVFIAGAEAREQRK